MDGGAGSCRVDVAGLLPVVVGGQVEAFAESR